MDEAERCTDIGYIYLSRLLLLGKPNELKSLPEVTPPGTQRYELDVPDQAARHLQTLRATPGIRDATLFGDRFTCSPNRRLSTDDLRRSIGLSADADVVREIGPTLEDVFVTLTGDAEKRRAAGEASAAGGSGFGTGRKRKTKTQPSHVTSNSESQAPSPESPAPSLLAQRLRRHSHQGIPPHPSPAVDADLSARRAGAADDHLRLRHRHGNRKHPDRRLRSRRPPGVARADRGVRQHANIRHRRLRLRRRLVQSRPHLGPRESRRADSARLFRQAPRPRASRRAGADRRQRFAGGQHRPERRKPARHCSFRSAARRRWPTARSSPPRATTAAASIARSTSARGCSTTPT